ncbi:MAG: Gldg family protein [Candidatus Muiribacteriota bacterium]
MKTKKITYRINNALTVLLVLGVIIAVNIISNFLFFHVDITSNMLNSLAQSTKDTLLRLEQPLEIHVFYKSSSSYFSQVMKKLEQFKIFSKNVKLSVTEMDMNPGKASEFGVLNEVAILIYGDKREEVYGISEERFAMAINRILSSEILNIYFLTGHGEKEFNTYEPDSYSKIGELLKMNGYNIFSLNLAGKNEVPEDCDILLIASPKRNLEKEEVEIIKTYFDNGGKIFLLLDTAFEGGAPVREIAAHMGFDVFSGFIADFGAHLWNDPTAPAVKSYTTHFITEKLPQTVFPLVRPIKESSLKPQGDYYVLSLINSDRAKSFIKLSERVTEKIEFVPNQDIPGPANILSTVLKNTALQEDGSFKVIDARGVISGDSTFATDDFIERFGNADLFFNCIDWLAVEKDVASVRPVDHSLKRIVTLTQIAMKKIFWISVVFIPLLIAMAGALVIVRREKE